MSLSWIATNLLDEHVQTLLESATKSLGNAKNRRIKNAVDPFSSLLIASSFNIKKSSELTRLQEAESALRGMSNALGIFHQNVLSSISGWENHDAGYDLECSEKNIIAEIKNKWNTMNAANRLQIENDLKTAVRQKSGSWSAYLVHIIPKEPERYTRKVSNRVYAIDGASFYELATGFPNAIHDLFDHLCEVMTQSDDIANHCKGVLLKTIPAKA